MNDNCIILDTETRVRLALSRWGELKKDQKYEFNSALAEHLCKVILLFGYDYAWEDFCNREHTIQPNKDYNTAECVSFREDSSLGHWERIKKRIPVYFTSKKDEEEFRALFLYGYDKGWEDFSEIGVGLTALGDIMNTQS